MTKKDISYSKAIEKIEVIIEQIEQEEPNVDDLSEKVKEVAYLLTICRAKLYQTEKEVEEILKKIDD